MPATDLANLRRARSRCHFRLKQAEDLAQSYRDKLADLEARIRAIAPELELPVRFRKPHPVFARTELTRLALAILRDAGEPLPIAAVAVRALRAKGVALPDPALRRYAYRQALTESRVLPRGPKVERRPTDVVGAAIRVARISVGEEPDDRQDAPAPSPAQQLGKLGGAARAKALTSEQRKEIARKAAAKRWDRG